MNKRTLTIGVIFLIYAVFLCVGVVYASDITNAKFYGVVSVTNNNTLATNVATTVSNMETSEFISSGWLNATATDSTIQSSGADVRFMPGWSTNPWCVFVPSIGEDTILSDNFYTKGVTGGAIAYFPGDTGMTVTDVAGLEPGAAASVELTDTFLDTTYTAEYEYFNKLGALYFAPSSNVTGTIKAALGLRDRFIYDYWSDVGTKIVVDNVTDKRIEYESEMSAIDTRCYFDMTSFSDTSWKMDFTMANTATAGVGYFYFGLFSSASNMNGYAGDGIYCLFESTSVYVARSDGGVVGVGGAIGLSTGTTYYCTLERNSAILATLSVYSDATRSTHKAGSPVTVVVPATVTGLRYVQATNNNDNSGAAKEIIGWIDNIEADKVSTTLTSITAAEYDPTVVLAAGNITLTCGTSSSSVTLGGLSATNTAANWILGSPTITPYIGSMAIDIGGVPVSAWAWEYAATFNDSIGANDGTPSFRTTSSSAYVSAELTMFAPTTQAKAPAFAVGAGPDFWDTSNVSSGNFTGATTNATVYNYPFKALIDSVANAGGVPYQIPSTFIGSFILLSISMLTSFFLKRYSAQSIFFKSIVNLVIIGVLVALHIYDWWMLIFFLIFEQSIWFGAQHRRE